MIGYRSLNPLKTYKTPLSAADSIASTSDYRLFSLSSCKKWQVYENQRYYEPGEDPWGRIKYALTFEVRRWARRYREARDDPFRRKYTIAHMKREVQDYEILPMRSENLIIGGGLTGSSLAFWLKQMFPDDVLTCVVVENTENFAKTRSMLGTGIISQQFSIPEMVQLAMFSAEFLRHAGEHLKILDNDPPDLHLLPVGVMHLARTQEQAEAFKEAWKMQSTYGAHSLLMGPKELKARFPFMNFDDIVLGTLGLENEGIFDTWQLLSALREKNISLGVRYIKGEFEGTTSVDMEPEMNDRLTPEHGIAGVSVHDANMATLAKHKVRGAVIRPQISAASARIIRCSQLYNMAGPWAGEVARRAGLGYKGDLHQIPLPIICTRRTNFIVHAPEVPAMQMPILMDPNGVFCRPDNVGHNFVCGRVPTKKDAVKMIKEKPEEEPPIDYNMFYQEVWPSLVQRVPSLRNAKVINAWHSYEDMNIFDGAPIIGEHVVHNNFFHVTGLAGYGPQMSIAIGKMMSERYLDLAYFTTNLRKFDMRRVMHGRRMEEQFRCA